MRKIEELAPKFRVAIESAKNSGCFTVDSFMAES